MLVRDEKLQSRSCGSGERVNNENPGNTNVSGTKGKSDSKDLLRNPDDAKVGSA